MPTKKKAKKKAKQNGVALSELGANGIVQILGDNLVVMIQQDKSKPPRPIRLPGETEEERAKRLADRKARTIKAFQMAYEDHQRRKAS
ncbi:MAG: hypothetical protein ABIU20_09790 [Blastocatellia bacterium]